MPSPRKARKETVVATRRKRESVLEEVGRRKFERSIWANTSLFLLFGLAVSFLAFFGLSPAGPVLQEGQIARVRVVAENAFSYTSEIETERSRQKKGEEAPPVYTLDQTPFENFRDYLLGLHAALTEFADIPEGADRARYALRADEVQRFLADYPEGNPFDLRTTDLVLFFNQLSEARRIQALREGLLALERLYRIGIYSVADVESLPSRNLRIFQVQNEKGEIEEVDLISDADALLNLRVEIRTLDLPPETAQVLARIIREGLEPNLRFDQVRTEALKNEYIAKVEPVTRTVEEGETIIEPNARVTPSALEKYEAYKQDRLARDTATFGLDALFYERLVLTLAVLLCTLIYLKITGVRITPNRRTVLLAGTALLLNLFLYRLILEIGDTEAGQRITRLPAILPYLLPVALAPMLIAMLLGPGAGIVIAGVLAILNGLMQGNSISVFVATFVVSLVGIAMSRSLKVRTRVVRAGLYSGLVMSVAAFFIGLRDSIDSALVVYQMLTAIGTGMVTGIALIGFLPIWESLFKTTTDITLLELTDFNHPLLRRLQMEAPGSYHHSLMVANLAENAAAAVGANPLVCRVCSLFHDIGKLVKPEYFTENQRDGYNPHIERNPSMSALVIKSHVKEGAVLAREYKLPTVIIDVIKQHHGTSLIQYFYYKALERRKQSEEEFEIPGVDVPRIELDKVNEDTYRYEGPRPQFRESAIIMLADSVEAAGRSLRKVTPQAIDELIAGIFRSRVEDGQLDNCPLTFQELSRIRESFSFTLLNMLHARIEYPKEGARQELAKKQARKKGSRAPFAELSERLGEKEQEKGKEKEKEKTNGKSAEGTAAGGADEPPGDEAKPTKENAASR